MTKEKYPVTNAIRHLRQFNIEFTPYVYEYTEKGGTRQTALELEVDEHSVIKTLIFDTDSGLICVLMHGDNEVSTKELARIIGVKKVEPAQEKIAFNHTGYQFGGTSPFGHRKTIPIYIEKSILELDEIYINGGKRGFIIKIKTQDLLNVLNPTKVEVAI